MTLPMNILSNGIIPTMKINFCAKNVKSGVLMITYLTAKVVIQPTVMNAPVVVPVQNAMSGDVNDAVQHALTAIKQFATIVLAHAMNVTMSHVYLVFQHVLSAKIITVIHA